MMDDFGALDLLSMGGFKLSSMPIKPKKGKLKALKKHHKAAAAAAKNRLALFLPMIGREARLDAELRSGLQGWPVALSWPTKDAGPVEYVSASGNHLIS